MRHAVAGAGVVNYPDEDMAICQISVRQGGQWSQWRSVCRRNRKRVEDGRKGRERKERKENDRWARVGRVHRGDETVSG